MNINTDTYPCSRFGCVEGDIDQREIHLIEQFSEYSNVELFWNDVNLESGEHERIIKAKRSLDRY